MGWSGSDEPGAHGRRHPMHEDRSRSLAERVAVEVFVHLMRSSRVRHYDLVAQRWTRAITRHRSDGPRNEILHHFELAPPFWPLTIDRGTAGWAGYGVNRDAACIRYEQMTVAPTGYEDGFTVERAEFGPECRQLMRRASAGNPAFLCERLAPRHAVQVVKDYLIEAAISLTEGRGPLVIGNGSTSMRG